MFFGIQKNLTAICDRDGLGRRLGKTGGCARLWQIDLDTLHRSGSHDDKDHEQHVRQIQHWRYIDVIVGFVFGLYLHGAA